MASEMVSGLLRRPILLGGLGLTAGAWLLHGLDVSMLDLGGSAVWGAVAIGSGLWWLKSWQPKPIDPVIVPLQTIDQAFVDQALQAVEAQIARLEQELAETTEPAIVQTLWQQLAEVRAQQSRSTLQLRVLGGSAVGKKTVMQQLSLADSISWSASQLTDALDPAISNADLILLVVTGDLTDSEFQTLQSLARQHHPLLLVFNKQDQYLPADRSVVLQQLRDHVQAWLTAENVVAIAAAPAPVKVRRQQPDGTMQEQIEQPSPELSALQTRLEAMLTAEAFNLRLATTYRQAQALKQTVQSELNQVRRHRALPIIEQYQWIAAGAAFANPVPSLDLLATATINAQMVMDLGSLYQQSFSLEQAKTVTGSLAGQMVKLGLVEMASQAITPLLKSHALTYVAGGTLQGLSAAYLTRIAGLSLVEYFEEQSQSESTTFQLDRLLQKLKAVFQDNQRSVFLQTLVKQGLSRLAPQQVTHAQAS
ncbi:MAG: DUF697 domain-containing protein [Elainella sp. Prado103]|jgi:hypothetical protein|nr:DUF697 domain-containing protein [Elainella sp. Prado103]